LFGARPAAGTGPSGYHPDQIRHAYGFDPSLSQTGAGQTIYIIDAFDAPGFLNSTNPKFNNSDLHTFDVQFGLPDPPSFTKVTPPGQAKPRTDPGWALEIALDVEWAHAIAPQANIVLVEAASNSFANLLGAVDYAVNQGGHVVSMSWGANDFSGESSYDSHFNKPGVAFFASSGDSGGVVSYPAASPYVVSVGGTSLPLDSSGNRTGAESAWGSGGGGVSKYEGPAPAYQSSYGLSYSGRATPDVAYDADLNTGFAVYDSTRYVGRVGWWVVGGTSAGAPQWAGLAALVDQGRLTPLSSTDLTSRFDYTAATGTNYTDITTGSNGYSALVGYDLATGLGSPLAQSLVPYLTSL
jgi:subtilase family serine protease